MIMIAILCLFLFFSSHVAKEICGPADCNLVCEESQICHQDMEVQCIIAPCCPQWSCDNDDTCPDDSPELDDQCDQDTMAGVKCHYGEQNCCGQTFPLMTWQCEAGQWWGFYVNTLCSIGFAPPCPESSQSQLHVDEVSCPEEMPDFNSECDLNEEGLECDYGEKECCGEWYPDLHFFCDNGQWIGYYIDTLCDLGLAPPCPDTTTVAPKTREIDETREVTCPADPPVPWSDCQDPGHHCPYGEHVCCDQVVYDVIFMCVDNHWQPMHFGNNCDMGLPCDVRDN